MFSSTYGRAAGAQRAGVGLAPPQADALDDLGGASAGSPGGSRRRSRGRARQVGVGALGAPAVSLTARAAAVRAGCSCARTQRA